MLNKFLAVLLFSLVLFLGCGENNTPANNDSVESKPDESGNTVPVEAMVIEPDIIEQKLPLTGVLQPQNSVDVVAEVSGKVIRINKELGSYVSANQTLAVIDDVIPESQYKQAQAQVLSAESNLEIAESNYNSDKLLFENGDISELEFNSSKLAFDNAKAQHLSALASLSAAKKTYDDTRMKSPISGFISRKNIDYGTMVSMGAVAYRVVSLHNLKLKVSVPQEVINRVRVGGKAFISIYALNGQSFEGKVRRISPQADETSGGFNVEISVQNKENMIKAGMTAKIDLLLSKNEKVLAIPEYALVTKTNESYVYKINNDIAELVKIELGESVGENIIVESGLNAGDKIVVVGMKNLGLKTKVKVEKLY